MNTEHSGFAQRYRDQLASALASINVDAIARVIAAFAEAREQGRSIFVCGNGGSASTASHFACDMVKGASLNREARFRIMALTDSLPTITAYSNDVAFDCVFVEQLKNFARRSDVVMAISGSGNSPNVVKALEYGNSMGCTTVALTGRDGGRLGSLATIQVHVPEPHMGRIEDAHMIVCHMIAYSFMEQPYAV